MLKKSLNVLFNKTFLSIILIGFLVFLAFHIFRDQPENVRILYTWIFVGLPFGMKRMCLFFVPKNFDIAGTVGVLAFNFIVGGIIGGFIVIWKLFGAIWSFIAFFIKCI
ncbi:DUF6050 family protein [Enterococcus plantarum]|uniref:DUF6050 family protein n=1 Tax=Enterococcus plantarum TaxID=1077675 RepID=UPI001A8E4204|nr:DUF6050 family protein [Enterococcus plantarum]